MEKVDRLGWAAGVSFVSYGLRIGIRVNKPEVLERLPNFVPPRRKPTTTPIVDRLYSLVVGSSEPGSTFRRYNLLYVGARRLARTMDLDDVLDRFDSDLRLYISEWARRKLFVHAGVVGWCRGAIVIPGQSFSGKSTLVAALVRAGETYYSDEFAVFDARGRVHPYPRQLSLRGEWGKKSEKCSVELLGGTAGVNPLPVSSIVMTRYRNGARWHPRPLSPGRAVLALLGNTAAVRRRPEDSLATLRQVVSNAQALQSQRGEAEEIVNSLLTRGDG